MDLFRANVNLLPPWARSFRYYFQLFSNHKLTQRTTAGLWHAAAIEGDLSTTLSHRHDQKNLAGNHRENQATSSMFSSAESQAVAMLGSIADHYNIIGATI